MVISPLAKTSDLMFELSEIYNGTIAPYFLSSNAMIMNCSNENISDISSGTIHAVFFSPPYNIRHHYKDYDDDLPRDRYLDLLKRLTRECSRVLRPNGVLVIDMAEVVFWNRQPWMGARFLSTLARQAGLRLAAQVPYIALSGSLPYQTDKDRFLISQEAMGHSQSQIVQAFTKGAPDSTEMDVSRLRRQYVYSDHFDEAFWPNSLVRDLIEAFVPGRSAIILDPFMGAGVIGIEAIHRGHQFIGFEVSRWCCEHFVRRLHEQL